MIYTHFSLGRRKHPFEIRRECDGIISPGIVVFGRACIDDVAKPQYLRLQN
jgi:hypothetical protein